MSPNNHIKVLCGSVNTMLGEMSSIKEYIQRRGALGPVQTQPEAEPPVTTHRQGRQGARSRKQRVGKVDVSFIF